MNAPNDRTSGDVPRVVVTAAVIERDDQVRVAAQLIEQRGQVGVRKSPCMANLSNSILGSGSGSSALAATTAATAEAAEPPSPEPSGMPL